jgi:hypothetical protein
MHSPAGSWRFVQRGNLVFSQPFAQRLFTGDEARRVAANVAKLLERLLDDAGRPVRGDQQRVVEATFLSGPGRFEGVSKVLV